MAAALKLVPVSGWHPLDPHDAADLVEHMRPAALLGDDPDVILAWWRYHLLQGTWGMVQLCTGRNGDPVAGLIYRIDQGALHVVALAAWSASDLDLVAAADDAADQLARAYGLDLVRMETVRPGLVRRLLRTGWLTRNVEMVRDVRR